MKHRLTTIHDQINRACEKTGRDPASITLIAVSKTQPVDRIKEALDLGITHFGENRVQEAAEKWPDLKQDGVTLHLIGPLQSNKVKQASTLFDVLHTLDRPSLVEEMTRTGWTPPCFVQVNTGEERQKSGLRPSELSCFLSQIIHPDESQDVCLDPKSSLGCDKIVNTIQGLMCIPPIHDTPALHFALLRKLAAEHGLTRLSMGMSSDFQSAIRCGATHIRVGSLLFGDRIAL